MKQGRWHDAIADCTCALDLDPKFSARLRRGAALWKRRRVRRRALDDLTAAAAIDPANKEVRLTSRRDARSWTTSSGKGCDALIVERTTTPPKKLTRRPRRTRGAAEEAKSRATTSSRRNDTPTPSSRTPRRSRGPDDVRRAVQPKRRAVFARRVRRRRSRRPPRRTSTRRTQGFPPKSVARWRLGNLDGALADCDVALGLKPGDSDLAAEPNSRMRSGRLRCRLERAHGHRGDRGTPAEEASPTPTRPTPTRPTPAKPDAVRRIAIEEDSDDSADDDGDAADPKAPPPDKTDETDTTDTTDTRAADELKRRADDAFKRGDMDGAESLYTSCLESGAALGDEKMALAVRANRAAARLKLEKYPEGGVRRELGPRQGSEARQGDAQARRGAGQDGPVRGRPRGLRRGQARVSPAQGVAEEIEIVEGLAAEASERARDARRSRPGPRVRQDQVPEARPADAALARGDLGRASAESLKKEGNAAFVREIL